MPSLHRRPPRRTVIMVGAALVLGGAGLWAVVRGPAVGRSGAAGASRAADAAFVGSRACAECHAEIYERYQSHPMARSLHAVDEARVIEAFDADAGFDAPPPRAGLTLRYSVTGNAREPQHQETLLDAAGEVIHAQAVPVHYVVGSGRRGRSYLTNRDGLLFMSPVSWYTQRSCWDLSPTYDLENVRFERRVTGECLECHVGRVAAVPGQRDRFQPVPFLETTIGCERCHGPGRGHVDLRRRAAPAEQPDPIVNPARLPSGARDSVCFQCHFKGERRLVRHGRTTFDFRPGEDVSDVWTIFCHAADDGHAAVGQVEEMLASACYVGSGGLLGCISCHDPHSVPAEDERIGFYRARCLECHGPARNPCLLTEPQRRAANGDDSCIDCHMPRIAAHDLPHTSQTDHRVVRVSGAEQRAAGDSRVLSVFGSESGRIPEAEVERARNVLIVGLAEGEPRYRRAAAAAVPPLRSWWTAAPEDLVAAEALAGAYVLNNDTANAVQTLERVLALNPDSEKALWRLATIRHEQGSTEQAVKHTRRLVELNPWNHANLAGLAYLLGCVGRYGEGIDAAERALELNPSAIELHGWLGEAYAIQGDQQRSAFHRDLFHRLSAGR